MRIRKAEIKDASAIVDLHADTVRRINARDYSPQQIERWLGNRERRFPSIESGIREGVYRVCVDESNRVLGFGHRKDAELYGLYVSAEHQGRGIGSMLLRQIEFDASQEGVAELGIHSTLTALGFYRSKGYAEVAKVKVGKAELDVVRMSKRLA